MVSRARFKAILTGLALYAIAAGFITYFGVNAYTGRYGLNARAELEKEAVTLTAELAQLKADRPGMSARAGNDGDGDDGGAVSSTKSLVGDLKSMLSAIVSGDSSGATSYATALQSDLAKVLGTGSTTTATTDPTASTSTTATSGTTSSGGSFLDDRTFVAPCVFSRWA